MKHTLGKFTLGLLLLVTLLLSMTACGGSHTVTFAGEGITLPAQQTVKSGECAAEPQAPVKEGYTFLGWYLDGADTPYDFDAAVDSDLTLIARFEAKASGNTFAVTFAGESVNIPAQTVIAGEKAIKPKSPVRAGYVFRGWFLEGADTAFDFDTVITEDITLYARYDMLNIEDGTPPHPFL